MPAEDISKLKIDKSAVFNKPVKGRKKIIYIFSAAALVAVVLILFLSGMLSPAARVQTASVSQIYPSQTFTLLNASGYVVAQRKAALASKITGRIIELNVEEGSRVRKGDIIARLESDDVEASRDQAEAGLNAARANLKNAKAERYDATLAFNRNTKLVKGGYIARAVYDTSEARYKSAKALVEAAEASIKVNEAALKAANVSIEYTTLRSPFDAVVLTKNADIGDIVTPIGATANVQSAVVTIADMNSLTVEVDVSEANIGKIIVGQPCDIQLDALPDMRFRGQAHMIVPTAERSKATVMVKVRFIDKDSHILPEMTAKVAFLSRDIAPEEMKSFTAVRQDAIVSKDGSIKIFVLEGDRVKEVSITTGRRLGDVVEILKGAKSGERVVMNPSDKLHDGSKIKTEEK